MRIVVTPSQDAQLQAPIEIHEREHWGVQRTTQQVKEHFYWPNWRASTSMFVPECAGCLHREKVNLKQVDPFDNRAININDMEDEAGRSNKLERKELRKGIVISNQSPRIAKVKNAVRLRPGKGK